MCLSFDNIGHANFVEAGQVWYCKKDSRKALLVLSYIGTLIQKQQAQHRQMDLLHLEGHLLHNIKPYYKHKRYMEYDVLKFHKDVKLNWGLGHEKVDVGNKL